MTFPTRVQFTTSSMASLTATANTYTFSSCTAGNLIVIALAGDKNTGTLSVADNIGNNGGANPWTVETSITGTSVCLYIAWKVAVGGETTVTATTSAASTTGNSGYGEELSDDGAGAWMVVAKATPAYNDTARTTATSGTTDTADHDGRALAVGVIDSVSSLTGGNTAPTFTNFTKINDAPATVLGSGGGHAGCYVGTLNLAKDATTSTTFATNGGSDQLTVAIAAFGRVESSEPVEKSGTDTALGTESGSVDATVDSGETALGTDDGTVAPEGTDTAIGTESGYVAEDFVGGDTGAGTESGDTSATSSSGEDAVGVETYDSAATIDPAADVAIGTEEGFIGIPGEDVALATDAHEPPTLVTVTTGEEALGQEGGYVETLFGDLIVGLYAVDPEDGALVALPDYESLDISYEPNGKGAIRFQYPVGGKGFDLLRSSITTSRDLEFELWTNGTSAGAMRGYLQEASGDDVVADDNGEDGSWQFAGSFLEARADEALVFPQDRGALITNPDTGKKEYVNPKRELVLNADTPGEVMLLLVDQAQDRGTWTDITTDFSTTHDSSGVPWAGAITARFSPGSTHAQILNKMRELGIAEWAIVWDSTTQEKVLKVWNEGGRGADLTLGPRPVTLRRGRNLLDAPHQWSVRDAVTRMLGAGAEGVYLDETDATALARRDRQIEGYTSLQNAADEEALLGWVQAQLAVNTPGLLSISHGIGMLPGEPRPVVAFNVGDWVYSQTGLTTERLRVVQWTLTVDNARQLSGTVTLNDITRDAVERLQEQLSAISSGEAVVGTSEPSPDVEDHTPPAAPEGVVASSIAYQDPNQGLGQTLAFVTVGWNPVTTNADGSDSPLVQTAVFVKDKIEDEIVNPPDPEDPDYAPFDSATWTWKDCPRLVQDFAAPLRALWVAAGSPADRVAWLTAYIAEESQTPTAADDVAGYRVRYSYLGLSQVGGLPSSDPFPDEERFYYEATPPEGTSGNSYSFGGVEGGSRLRIEVSAFDRVGNQGPWSTIAHDSSNDATPPPVPSAPTAKIWFATLDVTWDGLGSEGEPMPFDFFATRVWIGQGADMTLPLQSAEPVYATQFNPAETDPQFVGTLSASGTWNIPDLPYGVGWYVRLQSVDYAGNASAGSAIIGPFTAEQLFSEDLRNFIINHPDMIDSSVIRTAHIANAQIINALIADATIQAAKIGTVSAGSITTGTMTATVTVSGSLWTSLDSNATRLGFSAAGLQLYKTNSPGAGSTLVGEWKTSDGSMLVTGTYRSAVSGERVHIDPDGSFRLYPTSGTNYSQISNVAGEAIWRGPLDGSNRSGRVNVNTLGVGINFSAEAHLLENIRAELLVLDRQTRLTAPFHNFIVDERWSIPVGGSRRIQFSHIDSDGDFIARSGLSYGTDSSDYGGFYGNDTGWKLDNSGPGGDGRFHVTTGNLSGNGVGIALGWETTSSQELKEEIEDARAVVDPQEVLSDVKAKKWRFTEQGPGSPEYLGVIAEELPEVLRRRVTLDGQPSWAVDQGSLLGVLWAFCNQLQEQETRIVTGRALVPNGTYRAGDVVDVPIVWDTPSPEVTPDVTAIPLASMPTAMGKIRALVVPGSVTLAGCTVRLTFSGIGVVAVTNALPIAVEATGRYIWTPPYIPPEEP